MTYHQRREFEPHPHHPPLRGGHELESSPSTTASYISPPHVEHRRKQRMENIVRSKSPPRPEGQNQEQRLEGQIGNLRLHLQVLFYIVIVILKYYKHGLRAILNALYLFCGLEISTAFFQQKPNPRLV